MHRKNTDSSIPEPLCITIKDARERSGLGVTTLYACIKDGRLRTTKVGRRTLIIYESLKVLLGIQAAG